MKTRSWQKLRDYDLLTNGEKHEIKASDGANVYDFRKTFWRQCVKRRIITAAFKISGTGSNQVIICQAVRSGTIEWAKPSEMMFGIKR